MLTSAPRLRIRRPSPTTAEFTVTTLPPQTVTLRAARLLLLLFRITLSLATAFLLHSRWSASQLATPRSPLPLSRPDSIASADGLWWFLDAAHRTQFGLMCAQLSAMVPLPVLLPAAAAIFYVSSLRIHASESLLVMRGLGVQTSESPKSYFAGTATRFIPTEKIQDILINEGFKGFGVTYYLVVVVEGEEDVVVVFPELMPKRAIVETVWRRARECLYERRTEEKAPSTTT